MAIVVQCSTCGNRVSCPEAAIGRKGKCPKCASEIVVSRQNPVGNESGWYIKSPDGHVEGPISVETLRARQFAGYFSLDTLVSKDKVTFLPASNFEEIFDEPVQVPADRHTPRESVPENIRNRQAQATAPLNLPRIEKGHNKVELSRRRLILAGSGCALLLLCTIYFGFLRGDKASGEVGPQGKAGVRVYGVRMDNIEFKPWAGAQMWLCRAIVEDPISPGDQVSILQLNREWEEAAQRSLGTLASSLDRTKEDILRDQNYHTGNQTLDRGLKDFQDEAKHVVRITKNLARCLENAVVAKTVTDKEGRFEFNDIQPGTYVIGVASIGDLDDYKQITLIGAKSVTVTDTDLKVEFGR